MLRWIWENFSAVAGDQPSFERWPFPMGAGALPALHEVLLGGWGCPIGELFDLERLAAECRARGHWSFFVSSEPCNVPGGVARYVSSPAPPPMTLTTFPLPLPLSSSFPLPLSATRADCMCL